MIRVFVFESGQVCWYHCGNHSQMTLSYCSLLQHWRTSFHKWKPRCTELSVKAIKCCLVHKATRVFKFMEGSPNPLVDMNPWGSRYGTVCLYFLSRNLWESKSMGAQINWDTGMNKISRPIACNVYVVHGFYMHRTKVISIQECFIYLMVYFDMFRHMNLFEQRYICKNGFSC